MALRANEVAGEDARRSSGALRAVLPPAPILPREVENLAYFARAYAVR